MQFDGILIAAVTFLVIGFFHPIVIKAEYHFSKSCWPVFFVLGVVLIAASLYAGDTKLSAILAVTGACSLWSILELFHQEKRVQKGWYPENPKRKKSGEKHVMPGMTKTDVRTH